MTSSNDSPQTPVSAAIKLRQRLNETDDLILLPGVYDGFSARIALEVGFDGLYMVKAHQHIFTLGISLSLPPLH